MNILEIEGEPFHQIRYESAGQGGRGVSSCELPVILGKVAGLPAGVDGLLITSDLQGMQPADEARNQARFLGQAVAEELSVMCQLGEWNDRKLPAPEKTGTVLAGDLFAPPDLQRRGGMGDVRPVWMAFASAFRWVVGVTGNHDAIGDGARDLEEFRRRKGIHLLDACTATPDDLRFAGIGGVVGNPRKEQRHDEVFLEKELRRLLATSPRCLVLHEGPENPEHGFGGHAVVQKALARAADLLVVFGHHRSERVLATLPGPVQLLNVHERVVLLTRASQDARERPDAVLRELDDAVRRVEPRLESEAFVVARSFQRNGRDIHLGLTARLKKHCEKGRVWRSREFLATLKNASYGFDPDRPRTQGGLDGIFRLDRSYRPINSMMTKVFKGFLDRGGGEAERIATALGAPIEDLVPVRLVSHAMRLLGVLYRAPDEDWLVLVDFDVE